ncbi:Alpha-L-Rha alpha-1,3-L-rhamnosyltransferase [hydrothermal vent metagenome]|uniref:Alpha-L-Rha alpha-1,3-L-rhamnosyltransferase n=1 Tax=hydrothermal vent metagenome TaxID=652676 RepID=A0A1W1C1N2_9ZZZZ
MPISVCIATYNGEAYIEAQLESILIQLHEYDEVIISDDSSSDRTISIIEALDDKRILIFKNQTFASHVYNFEHALKCAKNEYIFLSDQDDIWLPNKREKMLEHLKENDLVLSDAKVVDEDLQILHQSFFAFNHSRKGMTKNLYKNSYLGCCMAFNRKILYQALPFPRDINMHDWWIGMIAELHGSVYFCDEKLILYRRHKQTLTLNDQHSSNSFFQKIGFRVMMIKGLFLSIFLRKRNT